MMVSIVVPVAREGYDLYERIYALHRDLDILARELDISFEIILASDLLHKPTIIAMARLAKAGIAMCLLLTRRIGKGGSIKNAVFYARGDYIVLLDADIPVPAETVCRAVLLASRGRLDLLARSISRILPYDLSDLNLWKTVICDSDCTSQEISAIQ